MNRNDPDGVQSSSAHLSTAMAWHVRWDIFGSMHSQSEDLEVFQALLLLETFEKMHSTRALHERAHIHHATTITLMRRGTFLFGRSPSESPPSYVETILGNQKLKDSPIDVWWNGWVRREAIRRVVFAAFLIDSTHGAAFGHSMIMATHELRVLLPCDTELWSAKSADEVLKITASLRANGVKPLTFLEGLQRTLNGQELHINSFARSVLLAGLLSVSWHMNQRDMQLTSLEVKSQSSERGVKWRQSITRAFDLWRDSLWQNTLENDLPCPLNRGVALGNSFALYYLAQLTIHANILECQIFAGARRLVGRAVGKSEVEKVQRRIRKKWAPSLEARRAVLFALRFLCGIFHQDETSRRKDWTEFIITYATDNKITPMHKWVLYSATLIVWCYTYAIDGPVHITCTRSLSIEEHADDMHAFLRRVVTIKTTEDVAFHRLNGCAGLLKIVCHILRIGHWEILHEGADLLLVCVELIDPPRLS